MIGLTHLGVDIFKDHGEGYLLLLGVALVTTSLLWRVRRRRRAAAMDEESRDEQLERLKQQRGIRGDLEDLMVEIEQLAKRMSAHLDAKTMHIEKLLAEADAKIEAIERLNRSALTGDGAPASHDLLRANPETVANGVDQAVHATRDVGSQVADPLAATIYEMADEGMDADAISRKLEEPIGKIELILALRKT